MGHFNFHYYKGAAEAHGREVAELHAFAHRLLEAGRSQQWYDAADRIRDLQLAICSACEDLRIGCDEERPEHIKERIEFALHKLAEVVDEVNGAEAI